MAVRYLRPERNQPSWEFVDLEGLLAADHKARVVWAYVAGLELTELFQRIKTVDGGPGRPPPDPRVLLALWLYATLEGVGSARQLDRLCQSDLAYRWLCGGVPVNYHGLSDFRVEHAAVLDRLLRESVTALITEGVVTLDEIAIDGTKVKASAGRGSFRRSARLATIEAAARELVETLKAEVATDPAASETRRQAARRRAAEDVAARAAAARRALDKLRAERAASAKTHKQAETKKNEPRASRTDPDARLMRFADGAVRAGYNVQLAVLPQSGIIVTTAVTDRRNDAGLAGPMTEQVRTNFGITPQRVLADTHYATQQDIVSLSAAGIEVYAPVAPDKATATPASQRKRAQRRDAEPEAIKTWRARMAGEAGKLVYKRRARIETVNGILKGRGLGVLQVRSMAKVACVVLLQALAHNLWRGHCLRQAAA